MVAALAGSVFAFGAVYPWAAPPLLILSLAAAAVARARPSFRDVIDASAIAALAVIALQLVPMPPSLLSVLSPASRTFREHMVFSYDSTAWAPLSLDPLRTRTSLMLAIAAYALHRASRTIGRTHGRRIARWVAWTALAASILGIGARTIWPHGLIYGFWKPLEPSAAPFGAIINRNHFGVWAAMAASLIAGCFAAQTVRRRERGAGRLRVVAALGHARGVWLLFAGVITASAIIATGSRSGFAALVIAAGTALVLMRLRVGGRVAAALSVAAVVGGIAVLAWAQSDRLLGRIGDTGGVEAGLRQTIWEQSAAMLSRYPVAGVGAGAFPSAMTYYQTGPRQVFFNHAHNQYMELATEGGLLLAIPLAIFAAGVVLRIRRELARDERSYFWQRIGATGALAGLAAACVWESPFRTPATLMIAAVASGLATASSRPADGTADQAPDPPPGGRSHDIAPRRRRRR